MRTILCVLDYNSNDLFGSIMSIDVEITEESVKVLKPFKKLENKLLKLSDVHMEAACSSENALNLLDSLPFTVNDFFVFNVATETLDVVDEKTANSMKKL